MIEVKNINRTFDVPDKKANKGLKSLFYRKWIKKTAVDNLNFNINEGEFVGFIGPNGAGKSTTIKMLTGVLTPTSGKIKVLEYIPYKQRYKYTYNIGVVFGQRRLLNYDIPVIESLRLFAAIYELPYKEFKERLKFFNNKLGLDRYLHIPVRKLSLGERMRCEIAAALLHKPKIIFLDEPTIGLDAIAKQEIRSFLHEVNQQEKTTIILTTHDMEDIEELCKRVIVIDEGKKIYDGNIEDLHKRFVSSRILELETDKEIPRIKGVKILQTSGNYTKLSVDTRVVKVPFVVKQIFDKCKVHDFSMHEQRLEETIRKIYQEGK